MNTPKTAKLEAEAGAELRDSAPPLAESDRARLAHLVEAHFGFVWRTLRRLGLPPPAADDGVQQVFLVIAKRLDSVTPGAEAPFLYRTACHVAANARRAHVRLRERVGENDVGTLVDPGPRPDEVAERRQARRLFDEVLEELDDDARQVFVLFELETMGVPEMATLLGIPEGTCSSRLRRAREQFQAALKRLQARQSFAGRR